MSSDPPRDLELLRAFVNTRDPDSGDPLASPEGLHAWLVQMGCSRQGNRWTGPGTGVPCGCGRVYAAWAWLTTTE